ncbi:MAG: type II toxin-antitoxin system VapC family toxin [Planctomycetota bacterium]|nr:type II toxin-antitoxin system VapC family toxin [Planctomycetota bacterium]
MKQQVYLETTIVSYLTARPSRDLILAARQEVTRQWWEERRGHFEIYVSQAVLDEAGRGDPEAANRRLELLRGVPRLLVTEQAVGLARDLVKAHALPEQGVEDALHIAVAAVHGMDILVTWNCRHIANAELMPAIRATIERSGNDSPTICTPDELMGDTQ